MFTKNTRPARHSVIIYIPTYFAILVKVGGIQDLPELASWLSYEYKAGDDKFCLMDKIPTPTIRDLYPNFTEQELAEAEDNLERYLALVLRIYERIQADPESYAHFRALTEKIRAVSCKSSESNTLPDANTNNPS